MRYFLAALLALVPALAHAQISLLQGGAWTPGHSPMYVGQGSAQPVVQDSGPAGGGGAGLGFSEMLLTKRVTGQTPPFSTGGTGPNGTNFCDYDGPTTSAAGYHYLCFDPNSGGNGIISYGYSSPATPGNLYFYYNGTAYQFPFTAAGPVVGPVSSTVADVVLWNNTIGTLLSDTPTGGTARVNGSLLTLGKTVSGQNCGNNVAGCFDIVQNLAVPPDNFSWPQSFVRIGTPLSAAGNAGLGSANQWGVIIEVTIPAPTSSANSYEKAAIFANCYTADPSPLLPSALERGCVGGELRGQSIVGNSNAEVWGAVAAQIMNPGSDGAGVALEADSWNFSSDQPNPSTNTTKTAIQAVALGTANSTTAYLIAGAGGVPGFHKGLYAAQVVMVPNGTDAGASFLELAGSGNHGWRVDTTGRLYQNIEANGVINTFGTTAAGQSTVAWDVTPTTGSNSDSLQFVFNMSDSTGVTYSAVVEQFGQTVATHGSMTSYVQWSLFDAGAQIGTLTLFPTNLFPGQTETIAFGTGANRYLNLFTNRVNLKPQAVGSLGTCTEGDIVSITDATTTTNGAALLAGGAHHVLAYCSNIGGIVIGGS